MYDIIKSVIESKRYELTNMLTKIDTIWVQGDITDEQRDELVELAQANAQPENSYAPLEQQINKAFESIAALENRVSALESGESGQPAPDPEEWPEYVAPTGAHDAYYNGDKITYNGKHYICIAPDDTACVWPPDVYPRYWQAA